jgi:hypothetical protein
MFAPTQLKPELFGKFLVLNVTENSDTLFGSDAKSKLLNNSRQQPHAIPKGGDGSMSQNMGVCHRIWEYVTEYGFCKTNGKVAFARVMVK